MSRSRTRSGALAAVVAVLLLLVGVAPVAALAPAPAPPVGADEPYEAIVSPWQLTFSPGAGAARGSRAVLWSTGAASAFVTTTADVRFAQFDVDAEQCEGAPHLEVALDGVTRFAQEVDGRGYYGVRVDWPPGRHKVTFRFLDDHRTASCDRNVLLDAIWLTGLAADGSAPSLYTSTWLRNRYVTVAPASAGSAAPGRATLRTTGALLFRLDSHLATDLSVQLVSRGCAGRRPDVELAVDGETLRRGPASEGVEVVRVARPFVDGPHAFVLTMSRDADAAGCDASVAVGDVGFSGLSGP